MEGTAAEQIYFLQRHRYGRLYEQLRKCKVCKIYINNNGSDVHDAVVKILPSISYSNEYKVGNGGAPPVVVANKSLSKQAFIMNLWLMNCCGTNSSCCLVSL